jgi:hypothetical protein
VLVGDETQEDADDPEMFQVNAVETLTRIHPALRQIVAVGVRGAWIWAENERCYVTVDD